MKLGMVGLGKMGANMTARLLAAGHHLVVFDRNPDAVRMSVEKGALASGSLSDLVSKLETPRVVWVMVPAGEVTESVIEELSPFLEEGDVVVDGGNSNYKDSMRRAATLKETGVAFVDVGTSGGVWGLTEGYSLMVGGEKDSVDPLRPVRFTFSSAARGNGKR